jgi:HlyD family secretion protein
MTTQSDSLVPKWQAAAVAALTVAACTAGAKDDGAKDGADGAASPAAEAAARGQAVSVATVGSVEFSRRVAVSGEVRPRNDVLVNAGTQGVRVLQVFAEVGDRVAQGQVLARLDFGVVQAQLASSNAQVERAQAGVRQAEVNAALAASEYARAQSVAGLGALSDEAIEQRRAQADAAKAQVDLARADMRVAMAARDEVRARVSNGEVRAPVGGLVIERNVRVGELTAGTPMYRIVGGNRLEVAAEVSEADIPAMRPGLRATFTVADGSEVVGTLRRPPAAIDSRRRVGVALFDLPGDNRLQAGLYLKGFSSLSPQNALSVPVASVAYVAGKSVVYVIQADSTVKLTEVALGPQQGDRIAITNGISPGTRIAAGGVAFLQDGDRVVPIEPGSTARPAASSEAAKPKAS